MPASAPDILAVLDRCCDACTFPMLDNGYVYLAATRLSLFRSKADWAMVIEVFGFSRELAFLTQPSTPSRAGFTNATGAMPT